MKGVWVSLQDARDSQREKLFGKLFMPSTKRKSAEMRWVGGGGEAMGEKELCRKNLCALAPL